MGLGENICFIKSKTICNYFYCIDRMPSSFYNPDVCCNREYWITGYSKRISDRTPGKNKLKICSNGDLFLDGEKIVIQEESSYSDNDSITNFRSKQSGWTSTPPSNIKSWKFRKETKKSHIYLNTKAGQISISALGIILFNAGWLGYVVSCASFIHTVGSDSKCLSLKRKTYDGIPKGYLAVKVVESAFTKANYKGKKKQSYNMVTTCQMFNHCTLFYLVKIYRRNKCGILKIE